MVRYSSIICYPSYPGEDLQLLAELEEKGCEIKFMFPYTLDPKNGYPLSYRIIYKERQ